MARLPPPSDHQQPVGLPQFSLPPTEWQVLGADLNCSESRPSGPSSSSQKNRRFDVERCAALNIVAYVIAVLLRREAGDGELAAIHTQRATLTVSGVALS